MTLEWTRVIAPNDPWANRLVPTLLTAMGSLIGDAYDQSINRSIYRLLKLNLATCFTTQASFSFDNLKTGIDSHLSPIIRSTQLWS